VTDIFKYVEPAEGRLWMRPKGVKFFATRSSGGGAEGCLGDPLCPGCRPFQPKRAWRRLEVQAELVHRG
jgi:hypothetical protein